MDNLSESQSFYFIFFVSFWPIRIPKYVFRKAAPAANPIAVFALFVNS